MEGGRTPADGDCLFESENHGVPGDLALSLENAEVIVERETLDAACLEK